VYGNSSINLISTVLYLVLLFMSAIVSILGSIWIIQFLTRRDYEEKKEIIRHHNIGVAMVLGAFIWTIGRMCLETIKPIMNTWYTQYSAGVSLKIALYFSLGVLLSLMIALLSGALVVFLAMRLLMVLTKDIDEWKELRKGNMAVAVIVSVTVIVLGMFFETIISQLVLALFNSMKLI